MKKIPVMKIFILFLRLPEDVRGSIYAAIESGIMWEKINNDKRKNKKSKTDTP